MTSMDLSFRRTNLLRNQPIGRGDADPLPLLLGQLLLRAGLPTTIERASSRPWASALFEGRRHSIRLHFAGEEPTAQRARFIAGLSEAEWRLPKYFGADITVDEEGSDSEGQWVQLSALTIRDW